MYPEADYLPLSGLQHLLFCPRQCALIHLEQGWRENFFTASGRMLHERVHRGKAEPRKTVRVERDLRIASRFLGLAGKTDAVEFYPDGRILPVEYKRGRPKTDNCDIVQLCAQAICLEEMLSCKIGEGAMFYFETRRRVPVPLTDGLRQETASLADTFHRMMENGQTPEANYTKKCESCSFLDICFPESAGRNKSVRTYIRRRIQSGVFESDESLL